MGFIISTSLHSQVNRIVKCHHLDVREAIMKVCNREENGQPLHTIFWAEQITTHKALKHSMYCIAHGIEPLLPFDTSKATYKVPLQSAISTTKLIAL
jgi:hypothetical protein